MGDSANPAVEQELEASEAIYNEGFSDACDYLECNYSYKVPSGVARDRWLRSNSRSALLPSPVLSRVRWTVDGVVLEVLFVDGAYSNIRVVEEGLY